jgi:TolB-like protein
MHSNANPTGLWNMYRCKMHLNKDKVRFFFIFSLLILPFVCYAAAWAVNSAKVLVIPFNINAAEDLSFLQRGIEDMLTTRLTQTGDIDLISLDESKRAANAAAGPMNVDRAISQGEETKADYVLFGSVTVLGDSISTDAIMVDVRQKKQVLDFNKIGRTQADLLEHVTLLAKQINIEISGPEAFAEKEPPVRQARVERYPQVDKDKYPIPAAEVEPSQTIITPTEGKPLPSWASQWFKVGIRGVALGDLDGDGRNETVFVDESKVYIHRYAGGQFGRIAEVDGPKKASFLGVDVADINKNGRAEIFVTNLPEKSGKVQSFVLEWDGVQFRKTAELLNWYFRVITVPERGRILVGQRRAGRKALGIFGSSVYEIKWSNGRYQEAEDLRRHKNMNAFSFTLGDPLNKGEEMLVLFGPLDYVRILDKQGGEEWKSADQYGGNPIYLEYLMEDASFGEQKTTNRIYLPQRMFVADLNGNGRNELVLVKNIDAGRRLLQRARMFKRGEVEVLEWNGKDFGRVWRSGEYTDYISDFTIGDLDNDGRANEIIFAVVKTTGSLISAKTKSYILTQIVNR